MMLRACVLALSFSFAVPVLATDMGNHDANIHMDHQHGDIVQQELHLVVELSGITGLGLQARNLAQQALNSADVSIGQQYDVVDRVASKWAPQHLQNMLEAILAKGGDEQRKSLLVAFHDEHVTHAREKELAAIQEQSAAAYRDYVQRLRQQPPSAERIRRIQELDQAMYFSAYMLKVREQVYPQIKAVLNGFHTPDNWEQKLRADITEFLLYVHRTTSNDELQRITDVYRDVQVQAFLSAAYAQLGL